MKRRFAANLQRLSARAVQVARDGDYTDGGGLILRVKNGSAVWVLRFTAPSGRRREMGLGIVDRNNAQAIGNSITRARQQAQGVNLAPGRRRDVVPPPTPPNVAQNHVNEVGKRSTEKSQVDQLAD